MLRPVNNLHQTEHIESFTLTSNNIVLEVRKLPLKDYYIVVANTWTLYSKSYKINTLCEFNIKSVNSKIIYNLVNINLSIKESKHLLKEVVNIIKTHRKNQNEVI